MDTYDPRRIEKKWQEYWEENQSFACRENSSKPKKYILDMFPYPSGAGLHVGHIMNYTATDIMARYWRSKGYEVLHPMGWDSFGLPAEQYAVRTGTHPAITTEKNINRYRKQLKSVGLSYDWSREFATSDPSYYKWTQWIFTKLHEKGLAYEAQMMVNYCPALGTVLANEEVENGRSVEGGHEVVRKPLRQWVLKITEYAQRLLDDLDPLDWPEHLKNQQRHWIGRSEGAKLTFDVQNTDESLEVFTTRVDTLMGVSFLALAPEHPLLEKIVQAQQKNAVQSYCELANKKSDLARTELNKDKDGVFTGAYAIHPVSQEPIPIWVADYVLMGYGSGCVMAVPAHDQRDYEFAKKYALTIVPTVQAQEHDYEFGAYLEKGVVINSNFGDFELNGLKNDEAQSRAIQWLEKKSKGAACITYKLRDWLFSRQRYWGEPIPILHLEDGSTRVLGADELPLLPPDVEDYRPAGDGQSPLAKVKDWVEINDHKSGLKAKRETNTMPQWAGSCWYYLRFCDPKNEKAAWSLEKENYWMPVDIYVGGVEHAVLHLLYARFWHKVLYDLGLVSTSEPFQCLKNQGMVVARSYKTHEGQYVEPQDVVSKDGQCFRACDEAPLIVQVEKMSKSKLNGVSPDEIMQEYGADSLRLYEMFMGPFDKEKVWSTEAVSGCYRFLKRVWNLVSSDLSSKESTEGLAITHRLVRDIEEDLKQWHFNTAIAKMMEWLNEFSKLSSYSHEALRIFVQVLYPFAPHISQELWQKLGFDGLISDFPQVDPKLLEELKAETITMVAQINGKLRAQFEFPAGMSKEECIEKIKNDARVQKYLSQGQIQKEIWVPNKLVNFVLKA